MAEQQKKIRRQKIAIVVLATLLVLSLVALAGVLLYSHFVLSRSTPVVVPDNIITAQSTAYSEGVGGARAVTLSASKKLRTTPTLLTTASAAPANGTGSEKITLELHSNQTTDNSRFYLTNMFPGDNETKDYCVRVSYTGAVTVHFHADIYEGYEKLAEVLKCQVSVNGQLRYKGLMRDMPESIDYTLSSASAVTEDLDYEITVYLDTSVGNEYQRQQLMADFRWWVEGEETPEPTPTPTPDEPDIPDAPVGPDKPTLPQLDKGGHYAYIIGMPDGLVHPEAEITRAEVATIFFRMLTEESRAYFWCQVNPYFDVPVDAWYNNAISTLTNAAILYGKPGNVFGPDDNITRAEFAAIAARFFEVEVEIEEDYFSDIAGHWANYEINLAYILDLVEGYPDGTFRPNQNITRAEAMTIMNRILERAPHKDHLLEDMIRWPDNMNTEVWYYADVQEATNSHAYVLAADCEDETYEIWTSVLPVRDWAALERVWSEYNSSANPGEPIGSMLMSGNMGVLNADGENAEMTVTTLRQLAGEDASLNILFSDCEVLFDTEALTAIAQGSGSSTVRISVQAASGAQLTAAQQAALSRYPVARIVTATVNEGDVSDFGDGLVTVYVPFTPAKGTGSCSYSVLYVAEDGTLEYVDSYYLDGHIVFFTEHFSDYVIVRDLDRTELLDGKLVSPLRANGTYLLLVLPVAAVVVLALFLILRRKEGKHERK